ncbi:PAS domain S-box protein [Archangium gephyra]|nr:PAS domain S-box protein [Archangium gephyra]AKJ04811.1 diguanylate cyclase/phosphodiesterase [Archangium gephyra]
MRAVDWSKTAVGPVEGWPSPLKTTVRTLLECRLPMYLAWGREFTQFYNDAYRPILGSTKHPQAMGGRAPETWPELWATIGPMWDEVWRGRSFGSDNFRLTLERNGYPEDCYFNFSYSPVRDEAGAVAGVLVTFAETTAQVMSERRLMEERDKLNNILQNLNDGIFTVDTGANIVDMNAVALRMHGYSSLEEAQRAAPSREAHFEVRTAEGKVLPLPEWPVMRVLRGERFSDVELRVRLRKQDSSWIGSYSGTPIHDAQGNVRLGVISLRDVTERRQLLENEKSARRAVEKSEAKFRSIFNLAAVGIARSDPQSGLFLEVNRRFEELTGYSAEELSRLTFSDITHPEDRQRDREGFRAFAQGSLPSFRTQKRYVRKDGRVVWVNLEAVAGAHGPDGRMLETIGIIQDITEEKQALLAVEERERRFRVLANSMPQIVWMARPDGTFDYFNERWFEYTGVSETAPMGPVPCEGVVHPDDSTRGREAWLLSIRTGEPLYTESRLRRGDDGTYRWFLTRAIPVRGDDGAVVRWFGTSTDIDQQKRAEELLAHSGELFRRVTETIPQAVWRTNLDGSADYFSQRFYEIVGYGPKDFLGWGWSELIHPDDRHHVLEEWRRCRDALIPVSYEFRVLGSDGRYRWFLAQGNPHRNERGEVDKYYGTWTRIDEQKHAQAELLELTQELQASVRARDEFLSLASHELKTPLTTLKLQAQVLQRGVEKNDARLGRERLGQLAEQSKRQIARLERLIDDMLDISRIRTGRLTLRLEKADFVELVREVLERMQHQFDAARLPAPELSASAAIAGVFDRLRMEQVMTNLLTNAIRYGGGQPIAVRVAEAGERVRLEVSDRGVGIAPEDHERIFERFERVMRPSEVSGLGLGLFITRQIVRAHGGDVRVESQLGHGSTFIVELPRTAVTGGEGVHVV